MEDIVAQSPTVLHIRVDERPHYSESPGADHTCRVLGVLKGEVAEQDITIKLRHADTYVSGEYIVMLDETAKTVTSPHSVYSLGDRDAVEQIYSILGFDSPYSA